MPQGLSPLLWRLRPTGNPWRRVGLGALVILAINVVNTAYGIAFMAVGVLMIVFRQRFVEWVANRNRRYGIVNRHDNAARLTAWFIGTTLVALGFVVLRVSIH